MNNYKITTYIQLSLIGLVIFSPVLNPGLRNFTFRSIEQSQWTGFVIVLFGIAIFLTGFLQLRKHFTIHAQPKQSAQLITKGIFKFIRNPMYSGGILMAYGWSIFFTSKLSLVLATALFIVLVYKITLEEAFLSKQFGKSYIKYLETSKKLIPLVW